MLLLLLISNGILPKASESQVCLEHGVSKLAIRVKTILMDSSTRDGLASSDVRSIQFVLFFFPKVSRFGPFRVRCSFGPISLLPPLPSEKIHVFEKCYLFLSAAVAAAAAPQSFDVKISRYCHFAEFCAWHVIFAMHAFGQVGRQVSWVTQCRGIFRPVKMLIRYP